MKRAFFYLAAAVMAALVLNSCSKSEQDEPDVKKPSIEEVLRLDDILYVTGETIDVDVMTAQYQKMGYKMYSDRRVPNSLRNNELTGTISYYNEQHCSHIFYDLEGGLCVNSIYNSQLFTFDMKDEAIQFINKRYNITLEKVDEPLATYGYRECYRYSNDSFFVSLGMNDELCTFSYIPISLYY